MKNLVTGDDTQLTFDNVNDDSPAWRPIAQLSALSDAHLWLGLKNSDDQGTRFDVQVELLKNGSPVASGMTRCVTGVTRIPAKALEAIVPWDDFATVGLDLGDELALRVSTRIGTNASNAKCASGHNSAIGLRVDDDATSRQSRFDATFPDDTSSDLYLRSNGNVCGNAESTGVTSRSLDATGPSATAAKCKDSGVVNFVGGNPWKEVGTWTLPPLA